MPALRSYFEAAVRPKPGWLVGLEHEKLPVHADGGAAEYREILAMLAALEPRGYLPLKDGNHVIGGIRGREEISLEPGLQVEWAGPPLATAAASQGRLREHLQVVGEAARLSGLELIYGGFRPFGSLEAISWLPKRRYDIMRSYLPTRGRLGHEMMKRTATVQVNLDFADEADAAEKIRVASGVTSIVTALFAASPISDGRPNGRKSYRAEVWLDVAEERCGLQPFVFEPGFGWDSYIDWALDVPLFFIYRQGQYFPQQGLTFRGFMTEGWQGERPHMEDWALHLSTLFPEVRLKRTIELRGADSPPLPFAEGLAALWRGLLYDPAARAAAWALVSGASFADRQTLRHQVPRAGLEARLGGRKLAELAVELVQIAGVGLATQPGGEGDRALLAPLADYAARGRSPADDMLEDFDRLGGDPARLVKAWSLRSE
jgi:glutamate--cysteine ligase